MHGRFARRRLPFLYKAPEEGLKVSALCGGRNGLYLEGSICGIPCLMLVDTGANVTLVRIDLAQNLKENFICTAPNISLKSSTGEKAEIHGKLDAAIECGCRKFRHRIYVADITDPCILGRDFLQKFNFTVDLEKNDIRTGGEEIPLFSASAEHSKLCSVLAKEKTIIPAKLSLSGICPFFEMLGFLFKKEKIIQRKNRLSRDLKVTSFDHWRINERGEWLLSVIYYLFEMPSVFIGSSVAFSKA
ncbi:hypothetical protein AVEN_238992-1 [Araneus ventricosus]|uniref:Peptidase A2 domain-containing protein n=1 Tax=Araneus ventricosus TaxID=182803 RepID=A0A4Y2R9E3_ARAVE|nr:hypothetical protein AVEN_238992-1 [Araneus ventricosus]